MGLTLCRMIDECQAARNVNEQQEEEWVRETEHNMNKAADYDRSVEQSRVCGPNDLCGVGSKNRELMGGGKAIWICQIVCA